MLDSIWLRSVEEGGGRTEEGELLSEVFVSEVPENVSGASEREVAEGGGEEGEAGGGSGGSRSWNASSSSVYARSSRTLKVDKNNSFSQGSKSTNRGGTEGEVAD